MVQFWIFFLIESSSNDNILKIIINYEFNTISFIRRKIKIFISQIYIFKAKNNYNIKVLFILINYLENNIRIDLDIKISFKYK